MIDFRTGRGSGKAPTASVIPTQKQPVLPGFSYLELCVVIWFYGSILASASINVFSLSVGCIYIYIGSMLKLVLYSTLVGFGHV